jgi:hypothetical protein
MCLPLLSKCLCKRNKFAEQIPDVWISVMETRPQGLKLPDTTGHKRRG